MSVAEAPMDSPKEGIAAAAPIQKSAFEGTGSPRNEVDWRVSLLNFARRSAAKATTMKTP